MSHIDCTHYSKTQLAYMHGVFWTLVRTQHYYQLHDKDTAHQVMGQM
jgi:hypothetical protein